MARKKVLLLVKVDANLSSIKEFNEYWERVNLPFWEENGAKHIGSYVNYLGAPKNQIIRLFEFEDLSQCDKFMQLREKMFNTEQGEESLQQIYTYFKTLEETLWISAY